MKTYTFQVVIEEDEWLDERIKDPVWRAYIPALVHQGASSWGYALKSLQDAVDLLIESLLEHGEEHLLESIVQHEKESTSEPCSHIQVSDVP